MPRFEVSASYVASLQRLFAGGPLELDGAGREAFERPYARWWHPASVALSVQAEVVRRGGPQALVAFERRLVVTGLGPMLGPAARVVRGLSPRPAEALLGSIPAAAGFVVRGLSFEWNAPAGALTIHYPEPVDEVLAVNAWLGAVQGVFELARVDEEPLTCGFEPSSGVLTLALPRANRRPTGSEGLDEPVLNPRLAAREPATTTDRPRPAGR